MSGKVSDFTLNLCPHSTRGSLRNSPINFRVSGNAINRNLAATSLHQYGLFRGSHIAIVVVLSTRSAEQRRESGAIFRAGVRDWVPTLCLRELATLYQRLKQVLTDVAHSIGVYLFRVGELVNPNRLRHVVLQVQAPLWHTWRCANTCSEGQMCSVGNQAPTLNPSGPMTRLPGIKWA